MSIRTMALTFAGAGVLASALTPLTAASAAPGGWRFIQAYRTMAACEYAGHGLVAHHQARVFRCDNDYDGKTGVPILDLYAR